MPTSSAADHDEPQPSQKSRREFLGSLATTAAVLATAGCANQLSAATAASAAAPAPAPIPAQHHASAPAHWDDTWFTKLSAPHKAVFDVAEVAEGNGVGHPFTYMQGVHEALGVPLDQVQTVVVIRHAAIPLALNDAMWAKYDIGKAWKVKDGKHWAVRNQYLKPSAGRAARPGDPPDGTLSWLARHGHILLGCNRALLGASYEIAQATKGSQPAIYDELSANLIPGLILQPSGVYAVLRAQEAGCAFFKSS
jgi:hypothetical protein